MVQFGEALYALEKFIGIPSMPKKLIAIPSMLYILIRNPFYA